MSMIDDVRSAMVAAMKAKDKERKESLSFLLSSLKNKAIDKRADLTAEEEAQVVLKEIKQVKETLALTPEDRTDIIAECEHRLAVLDEYAPKMMGEDEIRAIVNDVLAELGTNRKGQRQNHERTDAQGKGQGRWQTGERDCSVHVMMGDGATSREGASDETSLPASRMTFTIALKRVLGRSRKFSCCPSLASLSIPYFP